MLVVAIVAVRVAGGRAWSTGDVLGAGGTCLEHRGRAWSTGDVLLVDRTHAESDVTLGRGDLKMGRAITAISAVACSSVQ